MTSEEMKSIVKAYWGNYNRIDPGKIVSDMVERLRHGMAIAATVIDYLRGNIDGLPSPLTALASHDASSSHPSVPEDNGDPDSLATEVMKKLGSLGLQSLTELKGYKIDDNNHILLHLNGRMADTGWTETRPLSVLARIMREQELLLPRLP